MAIRRCSICALEYPVYVSHCQVCDGPLWIDTSDNLNPAWRDEIERKKMEPEVDVLEEEKMSVESWRLKSLLDAGYPLAKAQILAGSDVDLHKAIDLLKKCGDPKIAFKILG